MKEISFKSGENVSLRFIDDSTISDVSYTILSNDTRRISFVAVGSRLPFVRVAAINCGRAK